MNARKLLCFFRQNMRSIVFVFGWAILILIIVPWYTKMKNKELAEDMSNSIPNIAMLSETCFLRDRIKIIDYKPVVDVHGNLDAFAPNNNEEILCYYKEKFLDTDWKYVGTKQFVGHDSGKLYGNYYYWEKGKYNINLYISEEEAEYYKRHGHYKSIKGNHYAIHIRINTREYEQDKKNKIIKIEY